MALLHDLPESVVTDLPSKAVDLIGRATKRRAERDAWDRLLPAGSVLDEWRASWDEYENGVSAEARLVRAADKLELLLQAFEYERAGARNLNDFWDGEDWQDSDADVLRAIATELRRRRKQLDDRERDHARL